MTYQVGDRVRARISVYEPADDCHPAGYLCTAGTILIVRKLAHAPTTEFACAVSHEHVLDRSFWVKADEIEAAP